MSFIWICQQCQRQRNIEIFSYLFRFSDNGYAVLRASKKKNIAKTINASIRKILNVVPTHSFALCCSTEITNNMCNHRGIRKEREWERLVHTIRSKILNTHIIITFSACFSAFRVNYANALSARSCFFLRFFFCRVGETCEFNMNFNAILGLVGKGENEENIKMKSKDINRAEKKNIHFSLHLFSSVKNHFSSA